MRNVPNPSISTRRPWCFKNRPCPLLRCCVPMLLVLCCMHFARADQLRVSENNRYLVRDGRPFFFLCDTAWDLFVMCDRAEADEYLKNRADKGFNVIMAILIGWKPFADERNPYGDPPLLGKDPAQPNDKYFDHVDYIVDKANALGMVVAIAPSWSDWMYKRVRPGPHPFTPDNARLFGAYVGKRYKGNDIVWVIGGDRNPKGSEDILRAMAEGLDEGDGDADFLMTFHGVQVGEPLPPEQVYEERRCSSHLFGDDPWLDFHGAYSGHQWAYPTYRLIEQDRAMKPTRPVIDLEPCYENHPYFGDGTRYYGNTEKWDGELRGTAALIREQAYWAILAGAAGHTYCGHDVWGFYDPAKPQHESLGLYNLNTHWREAMDFPGAFHMGIMRRLFESRPWHTMVPDQSIVVAGQGPGENHIQAARGADGEFLIAYLPRGNNVTIDMEKIRGTEATAYWFNPRTGESARIGRFPCLGTREFSAPSSGVDNDWVLILENAAQEYPAPGNAK